MTETNMFHRILSWILVLTLLVGMVFPGGVTTAHAAATDPSETSVTEPSGQADVPAEAQIAVSVTNGTVEFADGTQISGTGSYTGTEGDVVTFRVDPAAGCEEGTVTYGGSSVAMTGGSGQITLTDGAALIVNCADVTVPSIIEIRRNESGWQQKATYTITVADNMPDPNVTVGGVGVTVRNEGNGIYTATIPANGSYSVAVKDASGNSATDTIQETEVDAEAPVIEKLERMTAGWATEIEYSLVVSDALSGIDRVTLSMDGGMERLQTAEADGSYLLKISSDAQYTVNVYDAAGNKTVRDITDSEIDTTAPEISNVTREDGQWDQEATYTFEVKEEGSGIKEVYIQVGADKQPLTSADGKTYSFSVSTNETVTIVAVDNCDNTARKEVSESMIDLNDPVVGEPVRKDIGWSNAPTYELEASDADSGIASVVVQKVGSDEQQTVEPGFLGIYSFQVTEDGTYTVTVTDKAGRAVTKTFTENEVDTVLPEISGVKRETTGWTAEAVYTFFTSDELSGVKEVTVTVGDGLPEMLTLVVPEVPDPEDPTDPEAQAEEQEPQEPYYTFTATRNGEVVIKAVDEAGNEQTYSFLEEYADGVAPVISGMERAPAEGWAQSAAYTFSVEENENGSGLREVTVTSDDSRATVLAPNAEGKYTFTATANTLYTVTAVDTLGNESSDSVMELLIDNEAPQILDLARQESGWSKTATYTFSVEDLDSGLNSVSITKNGQTTPLTAVDGVYTFSMEDNGTYTLTAADNVGNTRNLTQTESQMDNDAPVISTPSRVEEGWAKTATYNFTVEDSLSGVKTVTVAIDGGTTVELIPVKGLYSFTVEDSCTFEITAVDNLDNTATHTGEETQIDLVAPDIYNMVRQGSDWEQTATYTFQVKDDNSGIQLVKVKIGDGAESILTAVNDVYTFTVASNEAFSITALDNVGNSTSAGGNEQKIDRTAPEILDLARKENGWTKEATYTFKVTDSEAGVGTVSVAFGGEEPVTLTPENGVYSFTVKANGSFVVTALDGVGNIASANGTEEQVDSAAPEIKNLARQQIGWTKEATYTFLVDDALSGVKTVTVAIGQEAPVTLTEEAGSYTFTVSANVSFTVKAVDAVGNESAVTGSEEKIDDAAPEVSEAARTQQGWQKEAAYTFTVADTGSGIRSVAVTKNGAAQQVVEADGIYTFRADSNATYTITATDNVGNTQTVQVTENQVDVDAPVVEEPVRSPISWSQSAGYTFQTADVGSGMLDVTVKFESEAAQVLEPNTSGYYSFTAEANGSYVITARDQLGNTVTKTVKEELIDTTKPVILSLIRENSDWTQSASYTLRVADYESGIQSVTVKAEGGQEETLSVKNNAYTFSVDSNSSVILTVTDTAGNVEQREFAEEKVDTSAPIITNLIRQESSWSQTATYSFHVIDPNSGLRQVKVTSNGIDLRATGNNGTYTFTLSKNADFEIYAVDNAGNEATETGTETQIDTTAPAVDAPARTDSGWAQSAAYTFKASDTQAGIQSVVLKFGSAEQGLNPDLDGVYSFVAAQNGTYTVTVTDGAGNVTSKTVSEQRIDTTAPRIAELTRSGAAWSQTAQYTLKVSDTQSGIGNVVVVAGEETVVLENPTAGTYTFSVGTNCEITAVVTDKVGNETSKTVSETKIDTLAPAIMDFGRATSGWAKTATYSFRVIEDQSSVKTVSVSIAGSGYASLIPNNGVYSFTVTENAAYSVKVSDTAGNETVLTGEEKQIDTTAPEIGVPVRGGAGWATSAQYTFTVKEEASGIEKVVVKNPSGSEQVVAPNADGSYTFTAEANGTYTVTAVDNIGNSTQRQLSESRIDITAPEIKNLTRTQKGWSTAATYTFSLNEAQSGVMNVTVTIGDGVPKTLTPANGTYSFTLVENAPFQISVTDNVGNTDSYADQETEVDTTNPTISGMTRTEQGWTETAHYAFIAVDNQSGIAEVILTVGDEAPRTLYGANNQYTFTVKENASFTITVKDGVGHSATYTGKEEYIDVTKPVIAGVTRSVGGWAPSASYSFRVEEKQSGIDYVTVTYGIDNPVMLYPTDGTYSFVMTENAAFVITAVDELGHKTTYQGEEAQVDNTAPKISAVIRAESAWATEAHYSFTATDALSGIQSVRVAIGNAPAVTLTPVDGVYTFTMDVNDVYTVTVTDNVGYSSNAVGAESKIDTSDPVIYGVAREESGWSAKASYSFLATDSQSAIEKVTVAINDAAPVELGLRNGSYSFTMTANGTFTITAEDEVGRTVTYTGTESKIDTTAPTIGAPKRADSGWAKATSYSFTVADTQSGVTRVTVQYGDEAATTLKLGDTGAYTFEAKQNGTYVITATDAIGNTASYTVTEQRIDTTAPEILDLARADDAWTTSARYTFKASDTQSGVSTVTVAVGDTGTTQLTASNGVYSFSVQGNAAFTITVTDAMGNKSTFNGSEDKVDITGPVATQLTRYESGWSTSATYSFTAKDEQSGIQETNLIIGGKTTALTPVNDRYTFTVTANSFFAVTLKDAVGNTTRLEGNETQIDTAKPSVSEAKRNAASWAGSATYSFTASDSQSGIAKVTYRIGGEKDQALKPNADGSYSFIAVTNGDYTVTVTDNVGNETTQTVTESQIDTAAPEIGKLTRVENGWAQSATYTFELKEEQSGIRSVTVSFAGGESQAVQKVNGLYTFTVSNNVKFEITASDTVGNIATAAGQETQIDKAAPVISTPVRAESSWAASAEHIFSVTDAQSGMVTVTVQPKDGKAEVILPGADGKYHYITDRNTSFTIVAVDAVGNSASAAFDESGIDAIAPSITDITREPIAWSQSSNYSFRVSDAESGIASVKVFLNGTEQKVTTSGNGTYSFTAQNNGSYEIRAEDVVGNTQSVIVGEDQIDLSAPQIRSVSVQNKWDAQSSTVTFIITDDKALDFVEVMDAAGKTYKAESAGSDSYKVTLTSNGDYTVMAKDKAGNMASALFTVYQIDTEAPETPVLRSSAGNAWSNQEVEIEATAGDSQSGIAAFWYSTSNQTFDKKTWKKMDSYGGKGTLLLEEEQNATYYVVAEDAVGRISDPSSIQVKIDMTAPTKVNVAYRTDSASGYNSSKDNTFIYNDTYGFTAEAEDDASGIVAYEYRTVSYTVNTDWTTVKADEDGISNIVGNLPDGTYNVQVRVYDAAGNCSETFVATRNGFDCQHIIEKTPTKESDKADAPMVKLSTENGTYISNWTAKDVTIKVSGSDAISGIVGYEYRVDYANGAQKDVEWTKVPVVKGEATLTVTEDTNATFYFRAVTGAGNTSKDASTQVLIQKTAPEAAVIIPDEPTGSNGWYTKTPAYNIATPTQNPYLAPVSYSVAVERDGRLIARVDYGSGYLPAISQDGTWTITVTATDAAGNTTVGDDSVAVLNVDSEAPTKMAVTMDDKSILLVENRGLDSWSGVAVMDHVKEDTEFDIFLNGGFTVKASANGGLSGMDRIYYQIVADPDDYRQGGDWKEMRDGELTLTEQGKYSIFFMAVDKAGNTTYFSAESIILDKDAPGGEDGETELTILPSSENRSMNGIYNGNVFVTVSVEEPNLTGDAPFSGIASISYRVIVDNEQTQAGEFVPNLDEDGVRMTEGRICGWYGDIVIDSMSSNSDNVILEVTATDKAGNSRTTATKAGDVRVDVDVPKIVGTYDNNEAAATVNGNTYFNGSRTLTLTVTERNFLADQSYIHVQNALTGMELEYSWKHTGDTHTAVIPIEQDGSYVIWADIVDAAGNVSGIIDFASSVVAGDLFILDNTDPDVHVSYDYNVVSNESYFNEPRKITVSITEQNFDPTGAHFEVEVVLEDGSRETVDVTSWTSTGNIHTATMLCDLDGAYEVSVNARDAVGNWADSVDYEGECPKEFIIDTTLEVPVINAVADGAAYAGPVIPEISAVDAHLEDITVALYRTRYNEVNYDVTSEMIGQIPFEEIEGGKSALLDVFTDEEIVDGIYTLVVTSSDKAGNRAQATVSFSVNRHGSVYVYDSGTLGVIGKSMEEMPVDLTVTEYNPSGVVVGSARVQITRDGSPVANPIFMVDSIAEHDATGNSGWSEYQYIISRANFTEDGIYEVVISTEDNAGNVPENTGENLITFAVDTTAPELSSIVGLEKTIHSTTALAVTFTTMDNVRLGEIRAYVNNIEVQRWENLDDYTFTGTFSVPEGMDQTVRIVVYDEAGNVLDTNDDSFTPGYEFNDTITVSSNFFVRFYANKPVFYGFFVVLILAGIIWIIFLLRKRDDDEDDEIDVELGEEGADPEAEEPEADPELEESPAEEAEAES